MSAATHKRPVIIGVTGGSGSGKTSVSRAIFDSLNGHSKSTMIIRMRLTRIF